MRLTRFLKPAQVKLELEAGAIEDPPESWSRERLVREIKERILYELVGLLETTGNVVNPTKLLTDLVNRERKATTGIGDGIAIPHVRTMQARRFSMAFARSTGGVEFDAIDGRPTHFFFCIVSPPYDDKLYLQVYKKIGEVFAEPQLRRRLTEAADKHEVIRIISRFDEP